MQNYDPNSINLDHHPMTTWDPKKAGSGRGTGDTHCRRAGGVFPTRWNHGMG